MLAPSAALAFVEYELKTKTNDVWRVLSLNLSEGLNTPYACAIDIAAPARDADPSALLGAGATLKLFRSHLARQVHGIIHRVEDLERTADQAVVRAHLVPALYALSLGKNTRIFQDKTALEIMKLVLEPGLARYQRKLKSECRRQLPKREYTVQHEESDLDFVARLAAHEGIGYYFDHSGDVETLILFDTNQTCKAIKGSEKAPICAPGSVVQTESVFRFAYREQVRPTAVRVKDFDWTQPHLSVQHALKGEDGAKKTHEIYETSPALTFSDYAAPRFRAEDAKAQAQVRQEAYKAETQVARAESNIASLYPGAVLEIVGHERAELDQKYLITRVAHAGVAEEGVIRGDGHAAGEGQQYQNTFECLPFGHPFRPARGERTGIALGPQTATVVGPPNEEVFTDEHGRIKVQFHWDRHGANNENSSCFIRCVQPWAGPGFGVVFLPRIGMEVVVDFLGGNPDRPVVIGCVYNGQNPGPYELPRDKTKSGIVTASSPGSAGHNELTFEDAKGHELITMVAERDLALTVKNDASITVRGDQTVAIKGKQHEEVSGERAHVVHENDTLTVLKSRALTVKSRYAQTVGGDMNTAVGGAQGEEVRGDKMAIVLGAKSETIGKASTVTVKGDASAVVKGTSSRHYEKAVTERVKGERVVDIDKKDTLRAAEGIMLSSSKGPIAIEAAGDKLLISGAKGISVKVGQQVCIELTPSSIKLKAPKVEIDASGSVKIKGANTALN